MGADPYFAMAITHTEATIMSTEKAVVNSWNEWDPLKHVIVGRATGTMVQAPEIAVQREWTNYGFPLGSYGPYPEEMTAKAEEQLDNFARMLEGRGIRVDRPTPLDFSQSVQTPDWVQESMFGCMPPRDLLLTVGSEILEATMSYRSRWFEYLSYRPLLERYFKEDPKFLFSSAPKPRLTEDTYKKDWWKKWSSLSEDQKWEVAEKSDWIPTEKEPLFDAADIVRCGMDLFVQKSMVTNDAGIDWLQRHYPGHRVHKVRYRELTPWHMDTTIVPLRPGLVLINPVRTPLEPQRKLFEANGWEVIEGPATVLERKRPMTFCSIWLNMNLLVLDPKTVCVEASETPVMELLDKHGLEVVPVPFYEVSPFGGGLHCATADVYREGPLEDYFPKQIEGF
jgi:glycine amidinotransferase